MYNVHGGVNYLQRLIETVETTEDCGDHCATKAQISLILQFTQKLAKRISLEWFYYTEHNGVGFSSISPSYIKLHLILDLQCDNLKYKI